MEGGLGRPGGSWYSVQGSPLVGWSVLRLHVQCAQEDQGRVEAVAELKMLGQIEEE